MSDLYARPVTAPAQRSKAYGIFALVYSFGVFAYEIALVVVAFTLDGMDYGQLEALLPWLPFALISGVVVCTVTSLKAPRGRRYSVSGGGLMLLPLVGMIVASLFANVGVVFSTW
jgi:hypothetical protein